MHPKTRYKFCKIRENRARDTPLRGVYIPHCDQISVKISVLGVLCPNCCTDWGEVWRGGGDLSFPPPCQISSQSLHISNLQISSHCVDPAGWKISKSASEQIKYRRIALCAMLPVKISQQAVEATNDWRIWWWLVIFGYVHLDSRTDSRALRTEYCIVGIPHNTAI